MLQYPFLNQDENFTGKYDPYAVEQMLLKNPKEQFSYERLQQNEAKSYALMDDIAKLQENIEKETEKQAKEELDRVEKANALAKSIDDKRFNITQDQLKGAAKTEALQSRMNTIMDMALKEVDGAKAVALLDEAASLNSGLQNSRSARQGDRILDTTVSAVTAGSQEALKMEQRVFTQKQEEQTKLMHSGFRRKVLCRFWWLDHQAPTFNLWHPK